MRLVYFIDRVNKETTFNRNKIVAVFWVENEQQKQMCVDIYNSISKKYENLHAYETLNEVAFTPSLYRFGKEIISTRVAYIVDIDVKDSKSFDLSKLKEYLNEKGCDSFIQRSPHGYHLILPADSNVSIKEMRSLVTGYGDFSIVKSELKSLDGTFEDGFEFKTEQFTIGK